MMHDAARETNALNKYRGAAHNGYRYRPREPRRRPIVWLIVVLSGVTVASLITANSRGVAATGEVAPSPVETVPTEPVVEPDPRAGNGEVEIIESGYSPLPPVEGHDDEHPITWGALITNTSREQAVSGGVEFEASVSGGKSLGISSRAFPLLFPGETIAVGGTDFIEAGEIDKGKATAGDNDWWDLDDLGKDVAGVPDSAAKLTAGNVETGWKKTREAEPEWTSDIPEHDDDSDGRMALRFEVESKHDSIVSGSTAQVLFRDKEGEIVGAAGGEHEVSGDWNFAPGRSRHIAELKDPAPPKWDKVEVYPHR